MLSALFAYSRNVISNSNWFSIRKCRKCTGILNRTGREKIEPAFFRVGWNDVSADFGQFPKSSDYKRSLFRSSFFWSHASAESMSDIISTVKLQPTAKISRRFPNDNSFHGLKIEFNKFCRKHKSISGSHKTSSLMGLAGETKFNKLAINSNPLSSSRPKRWRDKVFFWHSSACVLIDELDADITQSLCAVFPVWAGGYRAKQKTDRIRYLFTHDDELDVLFSSSVTGSTKWDSEMTNDALIRDAYLGFDG